MAEIAQPVVNDGIEYWNAQPANYDGVLGTQKGFLSLKLTCLALI